MKTTPRPKDQEHKKHKVLLAFLIFFSV